MPTLEEAVNAQNRETRSAILGLGNFELSEKFNKFSYQEMPSTASLTSRGQQENQSMVVRSLANAGDIVLSVRSSPDVP